MQNKNARRINEVTSFLHSVMFFSHWFSSSSSSSLVLFITRQDHSLYNIGPNLQEPYLQLKPKKTEREKQKEHKRNYTRIDETAQEEKQRKDCSDEKQRKSKGSDEQNDIMSCTKAMYKNEEERSQQLNPEQN